MKRIPERQSYDSPPTGYKRYTAYVNVELFVQFQKLAKQNRESIKEAIEKALKWYISHGR